MSQEDSLPLDKEYFQVLAMRCWKEWLRSGRPAEAYEPTLNTSFANEVPYEGEVLFAGTVPNLLQSFEKDSFSTHNYIPIKKPDLPKLTTLDKACGLGDTSKSDMLLARCICFMSKHARYEAMCAAFSCLSIAMADSNKIDYYSDHDKAQDVETFERVQKFLLEIVDLDTEYFLSRLFGCVITRATMNHHGNPLPIMCFMTFWEGYVAWRYRPNPEERSSENE